MVIKNPTNALQLLSSSTFSTIKNQRYGTLPLRKKSHVITEPISDLLASVRRIDKSGLLEILEPKPQRCRTSAHSTDCTYQLETVPKVPDYPHPLTQVLELNTPTCSSTENPRLMKSKIECHLTSSKFENINKKKQYCGSMTSPKVSVTTQRTTSSEGLIRRCEVTPPLKNSKINLTGISSLGSESREQFFNVSMKYQLSVDTVGNDSRQTSYIDSTGEIYTKNNDIVNNLSSKFSMLNNSGINDEQRKRQQKSLECLSNHSSRSSDDRHLATSLAVSAIPDVIETHSSKGRSDYIDNQDNDENIPRGERAEAKGYEYTAIDNSEKIKFGASNREVYNDNIQTLRVIILSEQL